MSVFPSDVGPYSLLSKKKKKKGYEFFIKFVILLVKDTCCSEMLLLQPQILELAFSLYYAGCQIMFAMPL
jgi:hypothetical protein